MQYYTAKEIAKAFRLGASTVRHWMSSGRLKAFKKSGTWLTTEDDIKNFIKQFNPTKTDAALAELVGQALRTT